MLALPELPVLPTHAVGSGGVPSWLWVFREAVAEGKVGSADIAETLADAATIALDDMVSCGIDIVSDGEMFRSDFVSNFHERIAGLEALPFERKLGYPGPDQLDAFRCVEPLTVPHGYGLVPEVLWLKQRTSKVFVTPLQSPITQAFRIDPGDVYENKREVAWALVPFINKEFKAAVEAGARYLQFDEAAFWTMPDHYDELVELFNACVAGVEATIGIHLCFGNFRGRPATSDRTYAGIAAHLGRLDADVVHLEFANRGMDESDLWADLSEHKVISAGVIDVKGRSVEPTEVVAARIRHLLHVIPKERLWVSTDCGFSMTARGLATAKMSSLVAAAELVRAELVA